MEGGKRVSRAEKEVINLHKDSVFVSYQQNGYKDERTELRILRHVYKKEITKRSAGNLRCEYLLIQDQLAAHKTVDVLKYGFHFRL
jgi:hypothetical protein